MLINLLKHNSRFILLSVVTAALFFLPFDLSSVKINSFFVILTSAASIIYFLFNDKRRTKSQWLVLFISVLYFLIHIPAFFYSENSDVAIHVLQKKISLIVYPIIFFLIGGISEKERKPLCIAFVMGSLIAALFCLTLAFFNFYKTKDTSYFFYHKLADAVGMHAAYFSLYIVFATFWLSTLFLKDQIFEKKKDKIIYFAIVGFFLIFISLLSSRMQVFLFITGILVISYFLLRKKYSRIKSTIFMLGVLFVSISSILVFPKNRERIKEVIVNEKESLDKHWGWGGRATRELIWDCSYDIIKDNFIKGVGLGDAQTELQNCYQAKNYVILTYYQDKVRYNAHNQFLENGLMLGVVGIVALLGLLLFSIGFAIKSKSNAHIIFVCLIFFSFLTESTLERQSGVLFFSLFNSLFLFDKKSNFAIT